MGYKDSRGRRKKSEASWDISRYPPVRETALTSCKMTGFVCLLAVFGTLLAGASQGSPLESFDADEYFANIDTSLFIGEPDEETGARLAANPGHPNPESLGSYFQGDILLPASSDAARNAIFGSTYRWPNATIPYTLAGPFTTDEVAVIQAAITNLNTYTCVRWVPRTTQTDYVSFQNTNTGCWATAGRVGGKQMVNLQAPACITYDKGTTIHEMNHAIGFMHEHCRTDRDSYVAINLTNVASDKAFNFDKMSAMEALGVPYDYNSVMHYERYAFSTNGQPTITALRPLNGTVMGQRTGLSWPDTYKINRLYNCTGYQMGY